MIKKSIHKYSNQFLPQWIILLADLVLCAIAFQIAVFLRFDLNLTYSDPTLYKYHFVTLLFIQGLSFILFRTYKGIIRHTGTEDAIALVKAAIFCILALLFASISSWNTHFTIPISILLLYFFISLILLIGSRLIIKNIYDYLSLSFRSKQTVIIYGAGDAGINAKNALLQNKKKQYQVLCFIDDNPQKLGKLIGKTPVMPQQIAIQKFILQEDDTPDVVIAIERISISKRNEIANDFLQHGIIVKSIPPINKWMNGELSLQQTKSIKIEDLLERESIAINNKLVANFIENKRILITGAAGSIGSEIVRQLVQFNPKKIILIDQAESALYDLETELIRTKSSDDSLNLEVDVLNITNKKTLQLLFQQYQPELVFHAAAYKHVPLMEKNPYKAIKNNVLGTQIVADLASEFNAEKFVMISTDKAVNPTNVMGASKRLAEMYVHSLNAYHKNKTRFIITRFGNVLGSNGSVIPLFKKQIENGGPITVTHPDIIRYFMTIPEACQLVLEAGTMGKGGEVFVFDMGEPVKIVDLAHKMIKLSGLELGKDINIEFTGLRPGEKLYEELLNDNENVLPTYHSKIMIAKIVSEDFEQLAANIDTLREIAENEDSKNIVAFLKKLVPEYTSTTYTEEDLKDTKNENVTISV